MSNKKSKLGVISAVAAGTGTAIYLAQKAKKESGNSESGNSIFKKSTVADSSVPNNYRNTERGKYDQQQQRYLLFQRKLRSICTVRRNRKV